MGTCDMFIALFCFVSLSSRKLETNFCSGILCGMFKLSGRKSLQHLLQRVVILNKYIAYISLCTSFSDLDTQMKTKSDSLKITINALVIYGVV